MARVETKLALVILEIESREGRRYLLQLNPHLQGYNFLGGHIAENERPREAALRELKEELSQGELASRWGMHLDEGVPAEEWDRATCELTEIPGPTEGGFLLPFYSVRAHREGQPPEKTAHIYLYSLRIEPERYPRLFEHLQFLSRARVSLRDGEGTRELCRFYTADELAQEAWRDRHNPFPRFVIKQGVIKTDDSELAPPLSAESSGL